MSITKLLCGASAISLIAAGHAYALDLTMPPASLIELAEEVDFANETVTGNLPTLTIGTNNDLPVSNGYKLTITLTGDVGFDSFNPVNAITAADVSGQIVSTGGADGAKVVTVLFDVDTTGVTAIALDIPVEINSCSSDVGVSILLTDPNDNPIEGGNASLVDTVDDDPINALECVNAFQVAIFADDTSSPIGTPPLAAPGTQTLLALADNFEEFVSNADDSGSSALLGIVQVIVDTSAVGADLSTPVSAGDLDELAFDAVFTDETGFVDLFVYSGAATTTATADDTGAPTYAVTATLGNSGTSDIYLQIDGDVVITPQSGVIQNATVSFDALSGFAGESVVVKANGLDNIALEGQSFGPFDWVGDASKPTGNIFRVTGLTEIPQAAITISNSSVGLNGTYAFDMSTVVSGTGSNEFAITPAAIQAVAGAFGRGDVTLTFFSSDAGVDVDRLMSAGGVISAFGNDAFDTSDDPIQGDD